MGIRAFYGLLASRALANVFRLPLGLRWGGVMSAICRCFVGCGLRQVLRLPKRIRQPETDNQ